MASSASLLLATTLSRRSAAACAPSIQRRGISVGAKIPSVKIKEVRLKPARDVTAESDRIESNQIGAVFGGWTVGHRSIRDWDLHS